MVKGRIKMWVSTCGGFLNCYTILQCSLLARFPMETRFIPLHFGTSKSQINSNYGYKPQGTMSLQRGGIKTGEKQHLGRYRWTNAAPTHGKRSKSQAFIAHSGCHQQPHQHEATMHSVHQAAGHPQHIAPGKGHKGPYMRVTAMGAPQIVLRPKDSKP